MKSHPYKITCPERLHTLKFIIINQRKKNKTRSTYELYGIICANGSTEVDRVVYAPTSADFSPMSTKAAIACYLEVYDMVAEFRGAWKSDNQAKVVAYDKIPEA